MDWLFSWWMILSFIHVTGMILFQPYLVRALDRNVLINCPQGNSDKFCREYHPESCKFRNGVRTNVDAGALWSGSFLALIWELTGLFYFFAKRASKPDRAQKEVLEKRDDEGLEALRKYQARLQEMEESKELQARAGSRVVKATDDDKVYTPEPIPLKKVGSMLIEEKKKRERMESNYGYGSDRYEEPRWMR